MNALRKKYIHSRTHTSSSAARGSMKSSNDTQINKQTKQKTQISKHTQIPKDKDAISKAARNSRRALQIEPKN